MTLALKRHNLPSVSLRRRTSSTSTIQCYWCPATKEADNEHQQGFCCSACVTVRMRIPGAELTPKWKGEASNWTQEDLEQLLEKADQFEPEAVAKVAELRKLLPPQQWPKRRQKKEEDIVFSEAPRTLKLAKPARSNPNPPPPPPRPVFKKLSIQKPKTAPPAPLKNAAFVRTITVNGRKPSPVLLRKPAAPPAPKPSTAPVINGKRAPLFRRSGEAEI